MRNNDQDLMEDVIDEAIWQAVKDHFRTALKAPIIAIMMGFAIWMLSSSFQKAFSIGALCMVVSCFTTWRRYLEPISLYAFLIAVVFFAYPDIGSDLSAAVSSISGG